MIQYKITENGRTTEHQYINIDLYYKQKMNKKTYYYVILSDLRKSTNSTSTSIKPTSTLATI